MAQGPYAQVTQATFLSALAYPPAGTVQVMAADTPNVSAQREFYTFGRSYRHLIRITRKQWS